MHNSQDKVVQLFYIVGELETDKKYLTIKKKRFFKIYSKE
jgi:hypothetical protein